MLTTRAALTEGDVRMLVKGATPDERATAAHRICQTIERRVLRDEDRQQAQDILRVMAADAADRQSWLDNLRARGALAPDAGEQETIKALHRYLTWTPSRLLCVALTDAVGDRRTQNQPGTIDEYPNWRVPLCGPDGEVPLLEDVFASRRAAELTDVVR